jgi:hypothetical protein
MEPQELNAESKASWLSNDPEYDDDAFADPSGLVLSHERYDAWTRPSRTPKIHMPQRHEKAARPRERRPSTRQRTASRDGPHSDLPLAPPDAGFLHASRRMAEHVRRRQAKRREAFA